MNFNYQELYNRCGKDDNKFLNELHLILHSEYSYQPGSPWYDPIKNPLNELGGEILQDAQYWLDCHSPERIAISKRNYELVQKELANYKKEIQNYKPEKVGFDSNNQLGRFLGFEFKSEDKE